MINIIPFVNKDLSILTQVVFKAWIEANKKLPENKNDWEEIEFKTKELFRATKNVSEFFDTYQKPPTTLPPGTRPDSETTPDDWISKQFKNPGKDIISKKKDNEIEISGIPF